MQDNEKIEKFAKGNRISPTISATYFPIGTLGLGNDGNVWFNEPDKNGVVRWRKEILVGNYIYLSIGTFNQEYIEFQFNIRNFSFTLTYGYENGLILNSSIGNFDTLNITEMLKFCEKSVTTDSIEKYVYDDRPIANQIKSEIIKLIEKLSSLIYQNNPLRHHSSVQSFKVGDKVKIPTTYWGKVIEQGEIGVIVEAEKKNQPYLYVTDIYEDGRIWLSDDFSGLNEVSFKPIDNIELYEKTPKTKFKVGDFIISDYSKSIRKIIDLDSGNGQLKSIKANGIDDMDYEYHFPEKIKLFEPQPKFKVGDRVRFLNQSMTMVIDDISYDTITKKYIYKTTWDDEGGEILVNEELIELYPDDMLGKLYFNVSPDSDYNTYIKQKNGKNRTVLKTEYFEYIKPKSYTSKVFYWEGVRTKEELGINISIYLIYKDGIGLNFTAKAPELKLNFVITEENVFIDKMNEIASYLRDNSLKEFANEVSLIGITLASEIWKAQTIDCDFVKAPEKTPMSKFKIGDKIKIPTTRLGREINEGDFSVIDRAIAYNQPYLYVESISDDGKIMLSTDTSGTDELSFYEMDNLELYEPYTIYQKIDLFNPSPEERKTIIKSMEYNSDGVTITDTREAKVLIKLKKEQVEIPLNITLEDTTIVITTPDLPNKKFISPIITNESLLEIQEIYYNLLKEALSYLENPIEEIPKPKFKVGDKVMFSKMPFANFEVITINSFDKTKKEWLYKILNQTNKKFSASYESEIWLMEEEEPEILEDCTADPTLIVSDQVKRFYDLNKTKINKLNEKFSCKIIQALVSLSDYEKCGKPSTKTPKQPKSDLLSRISQLKL